MNKPNFLLIQVDQLHNKFLNCYGGKSESPTIDSIFNNGVGFENCTCQFPLCQPSRACLWTSLYPHETKVLSNGRNWPCKDVSTKYKTFGEVLSDNGYSTYHFGKRHDANSLRGFTCAKEEEVIIQNTDERFPFNFDTFNDRDCTIKTVNFLKNYKDNKPHCTIVDLINPHNICGWIGENKDNTTLPIIEELPQLPENFIFDDINNRSKAIKYICCSHNRQAQVSSWSPIMFRYYIKAYNHYLKTVDNEISIILKTLKERKDYENTIIIFFSDHGDNLAARGCVTKQVAMYEQTVSVPLAFSGPLIKNNKKMIKGLAANLDIIPTILDFANIKIPSYYRGKSLKKNIEQNIDIDREYVYSQWHTEWGYTVSPARMVKSLNYKYIHYLEDDYEELYDLKKDPLEKTNIAKKEEYKNTLYKMRKALHSYLKNTNDPYFSLKVNVDKKWRSHKVSYFKHKGIAAPMDTFDNKNISY